MKVAVKYVTRRTNRDGVERWYWQRRGHPLTRLPDDPGERVAVAFRLNIEAEGRKPARHGPIPGSLEAVIDAYQGTDRWRDKAPATKAAYGVWLRRYARSWGTIPAGDLTRAMICDFLDTIASRSNRRLAAAVLQVVLDHARYRGLVAINQANALGLPAPAARAEYFTLDDIAAWRTASAGHRHERPMQLAFALLLYTAQRPVDCLTMPWTHYDGDSVRLRQQKTRRLMSIPCHYDLRAELDGARRLAAHVLICAGLTYDQFNLAWKEIAAAAGLARKQARDVRRTAVVLLAQAGCGKTEIGHITGHSDAEISDILDRVYLVKTDPVARRAIEKLEIHTRAKSRNG